MKKFIATAFLFLPVSLFAQNQSSTRDFIDKSTSLQINKDWTITAEFYSGLGEYVKFYPVEVMNLKTKETRDALQLDMHTKAGAEWVDAEAWVGLDEVAGLIDFLESYVIPNLDLGLRVISLGPGQRLRYSTPWLEYLVSAVLKLDCCVDQPRQFVKPLDYF